MYDDLPELGAGLGYRLPLHHETLASTDRIDFLEVISDQYLYSSSEHVERMLALKEDFPVVLHGVGLSVGTSAPLNEDYVTRLASLVRRTEPAWFSDHLAFTRVPDTDVEQLTPLWFTEESLEAVCRNVRSLTARIPTPFLLENITYYFPIPCAEMTEPQFITRVLEDTDIGMLLDVNNVWVNSVNLGYDPYEFLGSIPLERVVQIHIAGGKMSDGMLIDTHSTTVNETVWGLLDHVLANAPVRAVSLEWDQDWPEFGHLLDHLDRARALLRKRLSAAIDR